jgi:uncharacterized protein YbcI
MSKIDFIQIIVTTKDGKKSTRYVNTQHIQQIYQENEIIYLELSGYDTLEIHNENISLFMDRFVR